MVKLDLTNTIEKIDFKNYEEKVKEVPYVFYYPSIPSQYVFLDSDGNELS